MRAFLLDGEMRVEQQALHARQPVLVAVGMAPARLHEGKAAVGDERGHGAARKSVGGTKSASKIAT